MKIDNSNISLYLKKPFALVTKSFFQAQKQSANVYQ